MGDQYNQLADAIARKFISRRDVKAVQHDNGIYTPSRNPFTRSDLRSHLERRRTFGHYMLSADDTTKLFAFDIDLAKNLSPDSTTAPHPAWPRTEDDGELDYNYNPRLAWLQEDNPTIPDLTMQLRCVAEALALRARSLFDLPVAVSYSGGKGMHVYVFTGKIPATEAREAAWMLLDSFTDGGGWEKFRGQHFWRHSTMYPNIEIETFPKQTSLEGKDLGNLMRLPMGMHRKTKQLAFFIDTQTGYDTLEPTDDPLGAIMEGNI